MVVIQSFAVYEVPGRVVAINPGGMEVRVLVIAAEVPLEVGLLTPVELGAAELWLAGRTDEMPGDAGLGSKGTVEGSAGGTGKLLVVFCVMTVETMVVELSVVVLVQINGIKL